MTSHRSIQELAEKMLIISFEGRVEDCTATDADCGDAGRALLELGRRIEKAETTLRYARFTDCGGEMWKPPLGRTEDLVAITSGNDWVSTGEGTWIGNIECSLPLKEFTQLYIRAKQAVPEGWAEALNHDLVHETERAIRQRDTFLQTGISTASHGGSHDTCFSYLIRRYVELLNRPQGTPVKPVFAAAPSPEGGSA